MRVGTSLFVNNKIINITFEGVFLLHLLNIEKYVQLVTKNKFNFINLK